MSDPQKNNEETQKETKIKETEDSISSILDGIDIDFDSDSGTSGESSLPKVSETDIIFTEPSNLSLEDFQAKSTEIEEDDEFLDFVIKKTVKATEEIFANAEEDRKEATEAINLIKDLIESQDRNIHGGSIGRLLDAISLRSGIESNKVKSIESLAKILTSRKQGGNVNINNSNSSNTSIGDLGTQLNNILKSE